MKNKIFGNWQGKRHDYEDEEKNTVKILIDSLRKLNLERNVVGIKQSFEDEGVVLADVLTMRRITALCDISMYVKIGGCEAITDINNCVNMEIDYIIPPMIETLYAFEKFANAVKNIPDIKFYFLCETKSAFENLDSILLSPQCNILEGIIVGRSDFTKSFGMEKSKVNSDFICKRVEEIFTKAKKHNLSTTLGGNISTESSKFIKKLFKNKVLDKIETRNIVVKLNESNVTSLDDTIRDVLNYEIQWLMFKAMNYTNIGNVYFERAELLKKRV